MALFSRALTAPLFAAAFLAPLLLAPAGAASLVPQGVPAVSGAPWGAWRTETVDDGSIVGLETQLALDSRSNPHITYLNFGADGKYGVFYATRAGLAWTIQRVDLAGTPGSLALDAQDHPHIAYTGNGPENDLKYAHHDGTQWRLETVSANPKGGTSSDSMSLALDAQGRPHIAFNAGAEGSRYAYRDAAGVWHLEYVELDPWLVGGWNRIALDSLGRAHVIYGKLQEGVGYALKYAVRTAPGVWTVEVVHPACGVWASLALDRQDRPHITCHANLQGLMYLRKPGTVWVQELVEAGTTKGYEASLQLDARDRPHVAYYNLYSLAWPDDPLSPGQLHYGFRDLSGKWTIETVDRVGQFNGLGSSLQLDPHGRPHVSYILSWWRMGGSSGPTNHKADLMYAEPAAATVLGAAGV